MVVVRGDALGLPTTTVAANFFVDDTVLSFSGELHRVGFELFDPIFGPCLMQLDISGPSGFIGSAFLPTGAGTTPTSWIITSTLPMDEIVFRDEISIFCVELIDNVVGAM